jgi:hypothetical protein
MGPHAHSLSNYISNTTLYFLQGRVDRSAKL